MNEVETAVTAIRSAMKQVEQMLPHTWIGTKADNWRADHEGHMKRLKTLFASFPDEEKQLIEQAQKKQAALDKKMHGTG
ncbi:hypothetical protein [Streptomyces sp. NBC_01089]|uniref:hypothetical protein n=1 Tax=Streptomyces sp. NBC_01089 TaxID=2903747 RepID=UPI00386F4BAC|nr:hypothetical protein OG510_05420 [Streptomyces sp. NBC_01089]